jgi:hypothetical protein
MKCRHAGVGISWAYIGGRDAVDHFLLGKPPDFSLSAAGTARQVRNEIGIENSAWQSYRRPTL